MRLKILLLGDDPVSLVADAQLLRERGLMVFTAFNMENINELIAEVKPDIVFFDAHKSNTAITNAYNEMVNSIYFTHIPVVFTLSEDDVYLVTRKRTDSKDKRTIISDNMIDAVKMALKNNAHQKNRKQGKQHPRDAHSSSSPAGNNEPNSQLSIQFYS